jgi:hypothetical protein
MTISDMILSKPDPTWKITRGCKDCDKLKADHLAVVAEKEADWQLKYDILGQDYEQKWGLSMRQAEQIAALTARIKELEGDTQ